MSLSTKPLSPFTPEELDEDIALLVNVLQAHPLIATLGSCSGHGRDRAYVDLAVKGMKGLRTFTEAAVFVRDMERNEALLDIALNWWPEVATSLPCRLWITLTMTVEGPNGAPSPEVLRRLAGSFAEGLK